MTIRQKPTASTTPRKKRSPTPKRGAGRGLITQRRRKLRLIDICERMALHSNAKPSSSMGTDLSSLTSLSRDQISEILQLKSMVESIYLRNLTILGAINGSSNAGAFAPIASPTKPSSKGQVTLSMNLRKSSTKPKPPIIKFT